MTVFDNKVLRLGFHVSVAVMCDGKYRAKRGEITRIAGEGVYVLSKGIEYHIWKDDLRLICLTDEECRIICSVLNEQ